MADNIQKTLTIVANYGQALDGIAKYRAELERAKTEAKDMATDLQRLSKELKSGAISQQQYANETAKIKKALEANRLEQKQYSDAIRASTKVVENQITQQKVADDSIKALRAQLFNLTKEYDEMSRAAREGAEGVEQLKRINEVTDAIKEAEEATQRYYRNVGNYESALEGMEQATAGAKDSMLGFISGGNPMIAMLANTASQLGSVKQAFAVAGQGAVMLGKQMLALVANPIGAFIALVVAALFALKKGIESSEERLNKFKVLMAPMQGLLDAVSKALGVVCGWLLDLVGVVTDSIMWLSKLAEALPLVGDAMKKGNEATREYINLERERQALVKKERDELVATAKREMEVSELRAKFSEKDKYNNKQRLAFLEQAIKKEEEQAQVNMEIAKKKLELLQREAAMSDNDAEMNQKLAEAQANVYKQQTSLLNKMRELNAQRVEAISAIKAEAAALKKAEEDKAKARREANEKYKQQLKEKERLAKETIKKEQDAWEAYEDSIINLIKDNFAKRRQQVFSAYTREIEDLNNRLKTEKNLTKSARNAISMLIISKQKEMNAELAAINKESTEESIRKQVEMKQLEMEKEAEIMAMRLENADASLQNLSDAEDAVLLARMDRIRLENEEYYALLQQQTDMELEQGQVQLENYISQEQARIEAMQISEEKKNEMILELEEERNQRMELLQQKHNNATVENERNKTASMKQLAEAEKNAKVSAMNAVKSAIDALGQHSKAFAIMSKIIALAEIAINTGKAIAYAVTNAMAVGFPACIPAVITSIAIVMSNIASAIATVKSAKFAKGGLVEVEERHKYADGGSVRGAGSGTSDSIHAMLSNGESVMTASATSMYAPILSALNQSAGGNAILGTGNGAGEGMLARAVARGLMAMPNPVVSVEEINTTARRVQVLENLASI